MTDRRYDLVLHGASGFVGRLVAAHLAACAPGAARIALSGRSEPRLAAVRDALGAAAAGWPLLVTDAADEAALSRLARDATAIATTVGPYQRYGIGLVRACATAGTHYADLSGEILFVRRSADEAHATAARTGARIVHACGYDSVPSDLGVALLARAAAADGAGGLGETVLAARARGGVSGGTIDSYRAQVEATAADPAARRVLADPYALSPDRAAEPDPGRQPDLFPPRVDPLLGRWSAPFVMGPFNTRIVRRSNALAGWAYGRDLRYREVMAFGGGPLGAGPAVAVTAGLAALGAGMAWSPTRALLDRVLPKPGTGPSEATMAAGSFRSDLVAETASGRRYRATVSGEGDPGYRATAVMFGEAALALAFDAGALPDAAGVLTPATALGDALVGRLAAAGMTLEAGAATGEGRP